MLDHAALAFLAPGLLFMALGASLVLGKLTSNLVIGPRPAKAFDSGASWQATTQLYGFDMVVAGAVVATTAVANAFAGLGVAFNVSVLLSSVLIAAAHAYWTARRD